MGAEIDLFTSYASGGLAVRSAPLVCLPDSPISAPRMPRSRHDADDSGAGATDGSIKAVLVDVEDVLYDASAWHRWLGQLLAPLTPRTLESEFQQRWQAEFLPAVYRGQQEFHKAFAACLSALGLTAGHVEEIVAASRAQRRREAGARRPYPGARSTLSQLKSAGITCGVLTNTDRTAAALRQDLAKLGLADSFDDFFTSVDMQSHLPHAPCFDHALQTLNVPAADVLFVSHDLRELQGASRRLPGGGIQRPPVRNGHSQDRSIRRTFEVGCTGRSGARRDLACPEETCGDHACRIWSLITREGNTKMSPTVCDPDDHDVKTVRRLPMSQRFRQVGPTGPYRAKDGAEPILPLPRWTFWALLGWSVGMATIYTAILAGWWE